MGKCILRRKRFKEAFDGKSPVVATLSRSTVSFAHRRCSQTPLPSCSLLHLSDRAVQLVSPSRTQPNEQIEAGPTRIMDHRHCPRHAVIVGSITVFIAVFSQGTCAYGPTRRLAHDRITYRLDQVSYYLIELISEIDLTDSKHQEHRYCLP